MHHKPTNDRDSVSEVATQIFNNLSPEMQVQTLTVLRALQADIEVTRKAIIKSNKRKKLRKKKKKG